MENEKLGYSILFIEDENDIRKNYVRYLKRHYHEVYEASDGKSGLEIYKEKKPDILIIDINLPKMSGLEMLEVIRQTDHTTRAIMLTAHSEVELLLQANELKLTKYLLKPISRDELKETLQIAIDEINTFKTISNNITDITDEYTWNHEKKELLHNMQMVSLTPIEKKIMELLFSKLNTTFSHDEMIRYVWDGYDEDKQEALKNAVRKLRNKLPEGLILNVYGEGFKAVI